jgi:hypothetical protein
MLRALVVAVFLAYSGATLARFGTYVPDRPKVSLEQALPVAVQAARSRVADLDAFLLQSVTPRVLKGDKRGMHWQFLWQEAEFKTHMRGVAVRVYMNDGSTAVEEFQE